MILGRFGASRSNTRAGTDSRTLREVTKRAAVRRGEEPGEARRSYATRPPKLRGARSRRFAVGAVAPCAAGLRPGGFRRGTCFWSQNRAQKLRRDGWGAGGVPVSAALGLSAGRTPP